MSRTNDLPTSGRLLKSPNRSSRASARQESARKRELEAKLVTNLKHQVSLLQKEREQLQSHLSSPSPPPPPPPPPPTPPPPGLKPSGLVDLVVLPARASDLLRVPSPTKRTPRSTEVEPITRSPRRPSSPQPPVVEGLHAERLHRAVCSLEGDLTASRSQCAHAESDARRLKEQLRESQTSLSTLQRDTAYLAREHSDAQRDARLRREAEAETHRLRELLQATERDLEAARRARPRASDDDTSRMEAVTRNHEALVGYLEDELRRKDELVVDMRRKLSAAEERAAAAETARAAAVDSQHALAADVSRHRDTIDAQASELASLRSKEAEAHRRQSSVQKQTERLLLEIASWTRNGAPPHVAADVSKLVQDAVQLSPVSPRRALRLRAAQEREARGAIPSHAEDEQRGRAAADLHGRPGSPPRGGDLRGPAGLPSELERRQAGGGVLGGGGGVEGVHPAAQRVGTPLFTPSSRRPLIGGILS